MEPAGHHAVFRVGNEQPVFAVLTQSAVQVDVEDLVGVAKPARHLFLKDCGGLRRARTAVKETAGPSVLADGQGSLQGQPARAEQPADCPRWKPLRKRLRPPGSPALNKYRPHRPWQKGVKPRRRPARVEYIAKLGMDRQRLPVAWITDNLLRIVEEIAIQINTFFVPSPRPGKTVGVQRVW